MEDFDPVYEYSVLDEDDVYWFLCGMSTAMEEESSEESDDVSW